MRQTVVAIPEQVGSIRHVAGPLAGGELRALWTGRSILGSRGTSGDGLGREIVWSGSTAELEGGGVFDEDPRTWGPRGWEALRSRIEQEIRGSIAVRPHARHVISDVPGCRRLIESEWGSARGVMLCYDPVRMLTSAMMGRAEDHLCRMYEAIELMPIDRVFMVVVSGVDANGNICGIDACGRLGETIAELARRCVSERVPLAVLDTRAASQAAMLAENG